MANFALLAGFCWYWCYYPHQSRDALPPVCGIFLLYMPYWTKTKQERVLNRNNNIIHDKHDILKALFYPREVTFYTDNVCESGKNSVLAGHVTHDMTRDITAKWYWCYYMHTLRDSVSPICGIFNRAAAGPI